MTLSKTLPTLSLALALIGGGVMIAPSSAKAGGNHISFDALKKDGIKSNNNRPGKPANQHTRGCNAINRCRG